MGDKSLRTYVLSAVQQKLLHSNLGGRAVASISGALIRLDSIPVYKRQLENPNMLSSHRIQLATP